MKRIYSLIFLLALACAPPAAARCFTLSDASTEHPKDLNEAMHALATETHPQAAEFWSNNLDSPLRQNPEAFKRRFWHQNLDASEVVTDPMRFYCIDLDTVAVAAARAPEPAAGPSPTREPRGEPFAANKADLRRLEERLNVQIANNNQSLLAWVQSWVPFVVRSAHQPPPVSPPKPGGRYGNIGAGTTPLVSGALESPRQSESFDLSFDPPTTEENVERGQALPAAYTVSLPQPDRDTVIVLLLLLATVALAVLLWRRWQSKKQSRGHDDTRAGRYYPRPATKDWKDSPVTIHHEYNLSSAEMRDFTRQKSFKHYVTIKGKTYALPCTAERFGHSVRIRSDADFKQGAFDPEPRDLNATILKAVEAGWRPSAAYQSSLPRSERRKAA